MKEFLEICKIFIDIVKQIAIVSVIVAICVWPDRIISKLYEIGITEGDFLGFKWKSKLSNTDATLQQAQIDKDRLSTQLKSANEKIDELVAVISNRGATTTQPLQPKVVDAISRAKAVINQNVKTIESSLFNSQKAQQTLSQNSSDVASSSRWLILVGSDTSKEAALPELQRAEGAGFAPVKIFHNHNYYSTAIIFPDRVAAAVALSSVKIKLRGDSYFVSEDKWCKNANEMPDGIIDCGS